MRYHHLVPARRRSQTTNPRKSRAQNLSVDINMAKLCIGCRFGHITRYSWLYRSPKTFLRISGLSLNFIFATFKSARHALPLEFPLENHLYSAFISKVTTTLIPLPLAALFKPTVHRVTLI